MNSWYDVGAADALHAQRLFCARGASSEAREHQHIILSPAAHCKTATLEAPTVIGERELGDARLDCWHIYLDWFDGWLKDMPDRIERMPRFRYYVMGRNEWRAASEWPPAGVELQRWFLRSGGNANTRLGDGELEPNPPAENRPQPQHGGRQLERNEVGSRLQHRASLRTVPLLCAAAYRDQLTIEVSANFAECVLRGAGHLSSLRPASLVLV